MLLSRRARSYVVSCIAVFGAGFTHASDDELFELSIEELFDEKVTVASSFEESELDAASSVSVITSDEWESRGARRVSDALEVVPSVVSYPNWGGSEAIAIRGFTSELSVRGIASLLDGVPLNNYSLGTSLYDKPNIQLPLLDRIEMIRGPGSTLYGTDAFHGVLSYQTASFQQDHTEISGKIGAPDYKQINSLIAREFGGYNINAGVSYSDQGDQDLDYQYTNPFGGEIRSGSREYSYENFSGFISVAFGEIEQGYWELEYYGDHYEASGYPSTGTQFFSRLPLFFELDSTSITQDRERSGQDSDFHLIQLDYARSLQHNFTVESQLYYWQSNQEWRFDNSRYPTSLTTLSGFTLPCKSNSESPNPNPLICPHELRQSADENRSGGTVYLKQSENALNTAWVFGIGADRLEVDDSKQVREDAMGNLLQNDTNPYEGDVRYVRYSLFQAKTTFSDNTYQLIYGARWDNYSDTDNQLSPRLGFIYRPAPAWASKWLYGHAFRAPTALEKFGAGPVLGNSELKPETIDTYEWVIQHHDKTSKSDLTLFYSEWDEGIILAPTVTAGGVTNRYENTGENKSYGVEVSHNQSFDRLILSGSGSYVRSENLTTDNEYVAFPQWNFSLGAGYSWPHIQTAVHVFERIMLNYGEADFISGEAPEDAKNYYRTDMNVTKKLTDKGTIYLDIRNLFDKDNTIPSLYNAEGGLPDRGISASVGVKWQI